MPSPARSPLSSCLTAAAAAVVVLGAGGCELFGTINCADDGDCPDALPFCVAGSCQETAGDGRTGRGVDGGCSSDADCDNGLCDLDGTFLEAGACLPPADDDTADCTDDPDVQGQPREAAGPVIFDVRATPIGDGCYSNVSFTYFQRDPQPITNGFVELVVGGGNITQTISSGTDNEVDIDSVCGATIGARAGILLNLGGQSNVGCLPVAE